MTTYILIYNLSKGQVDDFHPELIGSTATFVTVLMMLEVIFARIAFYLAGTGNISILDLTSFTGYKYVSVVVQIIAVMILQGGVVYWGIFLYFSSCSAFTVWKCLRHIQPAKTAQGQQ